MYKVYMHIYITAHNAYTYLHGYTILNVSILRHGGLITHLNSTEENDLINLSLFSHIINSTDLNSKIPKSAM